MSNPTQFNYRLPSTYDDNKTTIAVADVKQVNIGVRPKNAQAGVYPLTVVDVTFQADAQGVSHEPLAAFGSLAPGDYVPAAQVVMKSGAVSNWSDEGPAFTIEPPKPNPPTGVSAS